MLVDLLTPNEDKNTSTRFNIPLLTQRLNAAFDWLQQNESTAGYPLGLFGASTGAAAALQVAAMHNTDIAAVVSRGGRPDLAGDHALGKVRAPTLLIVGSRDFTVIELNRKAYATMNCVKRLETVPHATHLFEEPGKLEAVSVLASEWFSRYLVTSPAP